MDLIRKLSEGVNEAVQTLYGVTADLPLTPTKKEFEGDFTLVVFPLTKAAGKKPEQIGEELGFYLVERLAEVVHFNVIKGFLNLVIDSAWWANFLQETLRDPHYGNLPSRGERVLVEFSSPNTNKPLHLGHIRNILLGWSTSRILEAAGYEVKRVQIVNDRGIAICKSMLAWREYSGGATPESSGVKGDHLVGDYYVLFEEKFREEYKSWQQTPAADDVFAAKAKPGQERDAFFKDYKNAYFNEYSALGAQAQDMLRRWEAGDPDTVDLWRRMNGWVYAGFDETYRKLGVHFDKLYFESDTYLLGKDLIDKGLQQGVFFRRPDGAVCIDLSDAGMDVKVVLRSDGTSVYITQDIGTAHLRYQDFGANRMIYVVADEQNYHFQVLFEIARRLQEPYAEGLYHLSYGMVELPTGRMKSREGTVVDADDLIAEVIEEARANASERGEIAEMEPARQAEILRKVGMAALKFFILRVEPQKKMIFDPRESVDMQGQTGPYIQYAWVRINGILARAEREGVDLGLSGQYLNFHALERELLLNLFQYPGIVAQAAAAYNPAEVANYCYQVAKVFNRLWHDLPVFNAEQPEARAFRLQLSRLTGQVLQHGMDLLGMEMPEKM